ncbi:MAG: phenylalanine--tRNA ligase subunit beta [Deltaproteobacteria bacterium]|jgi:phenylalanyl-tRNA synthetase beta chain|nr:phenylalanine--tRNA ligase subunit beta [Deltaproteobacteria bacterium]
MKLSLAWLGDFVDISDLTPQSVADRLTMIGLEVEELADRLDFLDQTVAAKVLDLKPHGRHLYLCRATTGQEELTVVTGAPNVKVNGLYPLAKVGAKLPAGLVKATTMAGVVSQGILCSGAELELPFGADGLMDLPPETPLGTPLRSLYPKNDFTLDISITPNRADALSVRGIARDLSAALDRPLKELAFDLTEDVSPVTELAKAEILAPKGCWRYCGRVVRGVTIGPSPDWLVRRLLGAGLRPINNVVDVTNYVMLELGQPLHAFDLKRLADQRIVVTMVGPGQEFVTLDGQTRVLKSKENVLINDGARPVALGGVMGGLNTEVTPDTRDVFLEGACFNPTIIRQTSRSLGLLTDASFRFERGQDPELPPLAVDRAAGLLTEIAGGLCAKGRLDVYPKRREPLKTTFSPRRCANLLGVAKPKESWLRILKAIGLGLEPLPNDQDGELYAAILPTFRPDLTREIDLIEEAARLDDFQSLPATLPKPPAIAGPPPIAFRLKARLREDLTGLGLNEIVSYSFINPTALDHLALSQDHLFRRGSLLVLNPLSEDHGLMRPSLIPGLTYAYRLNQSRGRAGAALFEVGAVFLADPYKPQAQPWERLTLGLLLAGDKGQGTCHDPETLVDFWDIKGVVEALGAKYDRALTFQPIEKATDPLGSVIFPYYAPGQGAAIYDQGTLIGGIGELSPKTIKNFGLKAGAVFGGELDLTAWPAETQRVFQSWSSFPGTSRDLAILVNLTVPAQDVVDQIWAIEDIPLTKVTIFDVYQGDKIPSGQKSLALRLYFQSPARTLTDELVNGYFDAIAAHLAKALAATLRS